MVTQERYKGHFDPATHYDATVAIARLVAKKVQQALKDPAFVAAYEKWQKEQDEKKARLDAEAAKAAEASENEPKEKTSSAPASK